MSSAASSSCDLLKHEAGHDRPADKVGPHSTGAAPGPACYDAGNDEPTVTDANVVLGYLNPESLAGGGVPIRFERARGVIATRLIIELPVAPGVGER